MAQVINFPSATTTSGFGHGLFSAIARAVADYRLFLRTLTELRALNDRELRDLGISRYSIREIAYDSVYGR
ncbi:DUF1127 domain-containing protein [Amaricoccus solimangrovi]|uniref:DUF1127 domain-containing protein n=1 Tax=Amaricoccus solimangrovi TaxID=2589815 RepID=A0A501WY11_9RHOB|nr:DUF1127 domain-containing protein [Amaricoccus solimangrovi]TPE50796.1 DUF1127 domain-containing protein [Amaricoccus solimangrovi]